jgi:hypothetical protein
MPNIQPSILSIQVGKVAPLGPSGVLSGFVKRIVRGPVEIAPLGLTGWVRAQKRRVLGKSRVRVACRDLNGTNRARTCDALPRLPRHGFTFQTLFPNFFPLSAA